MKFIRSSQNTGHSQEEAKEADGPAPKRSNKELEAALSKGSLEPAKSKEEKEKEAFKQLGGGKRKKVKKPSAAS